MNEFLLLQKRVRNTISLRESHFREFKSAVDGKPGCKRTRPLKQICGDVAEALVAFANADGRELLIGVEDDGEITRIAHTEAEVAQILAAPTTHVYPQGRHSRS
jgi:ATP-dependent DNA helicase RecG